MRRASKLTNEEAMAHWKLEGNLKEWGLDGTDS